MNWIRSADRKACAVRAGLYLCLTGYGVFLLATEPGFAAYGIVGIGLLGIAINTAAALRRA